MKSSKRPSKNGSANTYSVDAIRKDFPILSRKVHGKPLVYFDNAATTQKPNAVIEALTEFYSEHNANVHRGLHVLSMEASDMYDQAHEKVADFIGADGMEEVVFTQGTTDSLNLVAYAYALHEVGPGDEILASVMEHHSNFVPWQQMAKLKGATFKQIPITPDGHLDMEAAKRLLTSKTKLLTVTAASNVLGTINPIRALGELAHDKGALVLVDAAQSVPHMPVDVKKDDVDLLAFSGHKMCGPTGIGALYGKREILEAMKPYRYGGEMIKRVTFEESRWNELPWKFEAGTPIIGPGIGLGAAVDYLSKIGMSNIRRHEIALTKYALKRLAEVKGVKVYGPQKAEERSGLAAFTFGDIHAHDVADLLDREGVAVRAGHHCAQPLASLLDVMSTARASFYLYNHQKEVDVMIEALHKIRAVFDRKPAAKVKA
ncbi:MAG TPA: cysteine desulfurase [Candidatus Thermoplasmatota archaeon]